MGRAGTPQRSSGEILVYALKATFPLWSDVLEQLLADGFEGRLAPLRVSRRSFHPLDGHSEKAFVLTPFQETGIDQFIPAFIEQLKP